MTRSMKVSEVRFLDAKKGFGASVEPLKETDQKKQEVESLLSHAPVGMRKVAFGIAFAFLITFSSSVNAQKQEQPTVEMVCFPKTQQDTSGNVCIATAQYGVVPDAMLIKDYDSYKKGELDDGAMNVRIAVAAAKFVKDNNLDPKHFSEVMKALKEVLEQVYECNNKPQQVKNVPKQKGKDEKKDEGENTEAKQNVIIALKVSDKDSDKKESPDVLASGEKGKSESKPANALEVIPENQGIDSASAKDQGVDQKGNENGEESDKSSEPEDDALTKIIHEKLMEDEEEGKKKRFEIAVPISGASAEILDPYGEKLKVIGGSAPVLFSIGLTDNVGLSVMGGYDGGNYAIPGTSYSRHASLLGAGILLKLDDLSINVLATLNGKQARESLGLMFMMNSDALRLLASTQFREDAPTMFAMKYWNTESNYPLILQMDGMLGSFRDSANLSKYLVQAGIIQAQFPFGSGLQIYPNIVIGSLIYNMNANPNYKFLGAGEIGGSFTYKGLNLGAAYLRGITTYGAYFDDDSKTYNRGGKTYHGEIRNNTEAVDGLTVFGNIKLMSINDTVNLDASIRYVMIGRNQMFLPDLGITIRW